MKNAIDGLTRRHVAATPTVARSDRTRPALGGVAAAILVALMATACAGPTTTTATSTTTTTTTTTHPPGTPTPSATTARVIPTVTGPFNGDELAWLQGIGGLHTAMDTVPSTIDQTVMHSLAGRLGTCTHTLDQLGSPSQRLIPAYQLAHQGCTRYEDGSRCFATAAGLGVVVAGSAGDRKQTEAVNCGFDALSDGSNLMAQAEAEGFDIQAAAH